VGDAKVAVKFDPENLGRISVWIDDAWLTVPAIVASFDGVHLDHWCEAIKDLRRRNLVKSSLTRHYVDEALRDLASMGRLAISFADVSAPTQTADDLDRTERELLYGFDIVDPNDGEFPESANDPSTDERRERFANAIPIVDTPAGADATPRPSDGTEPAANKPTVRTRKPNLKLED
jgi:putative transposase